MKNINASCKYKLINKINNKKFKNFLKLIYKQWNKNVNFLKIK